MITTRFGQLHVGARFIDPYSNGEFIKASQTEACPVDSTPDDRGLFGAGELVQIDAPKTEQQTSSIN